jgi:hypothetical protein
MNSNRINFSPTPEEIKAALQYIADHRADIEWHFAQGDESATLLYMEHIAYEAKPCRYNGAWLIVRQQRYAASRAVQS